MKRNILILLSILTAIFTLISCGGGGGGGGGVVSSSNSTPPSSGPDSGTSSLTLQWEAPTTNSDGSPLTDLAGYKVYYGTSSQNYTQSIDVGNSTGAVISNLSQGTWCFSATAYDSNGNESDYSNEVCTSV